MPSGTDSKLNPILRRSFVSPSKPRQHADAEIPSAASAESQTLTTIFTHSISNSAIQFRQPNSPFITDLISAEQGLFCCFLSATVTLATPTPVYPKSISSTMLLQSPTDVATITIPASDDLSSPSSSSSSIIAPLVGALLVTIALSVILFFVLFRRYKRSKNHNGCGDGIGSDRTMEDALDSSVPLFIVAHESSDSNGITAVIVHQSSESTINDDATRKSLSPSVKSHAIDVDAHEKPAGGTCATEDPIQATRTPPVMTVNVPSPPGSERSRSGSRNFGQSLPIVWSRTTSKGSTASSVFIPSKFRSQEFTNVRWKPPPPSTAAVAVATVRASLEGVLPRRKLGGGNESMTGDTFRRQSMPSSVPDSVYSEESERGEV
ncbi:hypothetical protein HK100_003206 [Physocladia obscura]|uniref:Uncharacterized protein n=1 Tax=Physocladia obscura TaxID=109957 RepID=A0AAD5SWG8_9FUNG|nr:hypothetical protein HK100_003206 [Physocladia obscura]